MTLSGEGAMLLLSGEEHADTDNAYDQAGFAAFARG